MTDRGRVLLLASSLVVFIATVLGVRAELRDLELPLVGLARLASTPRAPAPTVEEEIRELARHIDWDDTSVPAPAAVRESKAEPIRHRRSAAGSLVPGAALSGRQDLTRKQLKVYLHRVISNNIETLANSLGLSASQKERITAWMDWRRLSKERLGDEDKAAIDAAYEAAVARELDNQQREKYAELTAGSVALRLPEGTRLGAASALAAGVNE